MGAMRGLFVTSALALGLLVNTGACDSSVLVDTGNPSAPGSGGGKIDERCYERCVSKGGSEMDCTEECGVPDDGFGSGDPGETTSGGGTGKGVPGDPGEEEEEKFDGGVERDCYECMKKNALACDDEYEACEESLACTMLSQCPYECFGDSECIEECNSIIPSGVETLTALVQCMICEGGPCASDCDGSILGSYCEG